MLRLSSKVVLVTGGAEGIGRAIAERLKADGAQVVISDVQRTLGHRTAVECGVTFVEQDVSDEARWSEVVAEIEQRFGHLDVLVNNAGILGPMDAIDPENTRFSDWKRIFEVNVDGVFLGCRAAIPAMRRAGAGVIVNVSSIAGLTATPFATAYGASKATVRHLTKSIAQYCVQEGLSIRCNSVHPGVVMTPLWKRSVRERAQRLGLLADEFIEEARARSTGGFSLPEDVAAVVSFVASDEARRMNGARLMVDGGAFDCDTYHSHLLSLQHRLRAESQSSSP